MVHVPTPWNDPKRKLARAGQRKEIGKFIIIALSVSVLILLFVFLMFTHHTPLLR
jgi:hypothetical protein